MELLNPLDYTAILAFNDEIAYRIINTFRTAHVKIPKDILHQRFNSVANAIEFKTLLLYNKAKVDAHGISIETDSFLGNLFWSFEISREKFFLLPVFNAYFVHSY